MKDVVIPITGDLDIGRATALVFDNEGTRLPKADWRGSNGSDCAQVLCRVAGIEQVFNSPREIQMNNSSEKNKRLVLEAFDTLFNKHDIAAAERFWSPTYIQHSAHIPPGREGLFNLVRSVPETMRYDNQLIVAEGDYVMLHGRFSGIGKPVDWIVADIVRLKDGLLQEHWDVIQDEATQAQSVSGLPMFGNRFPS